MTAFQFLHTADVHLDSPLLGLSKQDGAVAERIRNATREAFELLIDYAMEQQVAFLIIAGDLYDGDWRDFNTGLFFTAQMGRLRQGGIPAYLLYGNHDAESQITRRLELPDNVRVFPSRRPKSFRMDDLNVVLHGQSYRQRDISENLARGYPKATGGAFNIGVLHTGLGGMGGHANYAPCALDELINKGYEYWALGHVHQAQVLHKAPYVIFPGNLQGRHIRETGPKGACLVEVHDGEVIGTSAIHTDVVRWARLDVSLTGARRIDDAMTRMRTALENAIDSMADGRMLACRIEFRGRTEIHQQLLLNQARLLVEARAEALGIGDAVAWVERIVVATQPQAPRNDSPEQQETFGELRQLLRVAHDDEELIARLANDIGRFIHKLPDGVRTEVEDAVLRKAIEEDYVGLIKETTPLLSAHLLAGDG